MKALSISDLLSNALSFEKLVSKIGVYIEEKQNLLFTPQAPPRQNSVGMLPLPLNNILLLHISIVRSRNFQSKLTLLVHHVTSNAVFLSAF